jgi:acyl-CoA thioesterase-1
MISMKKNWILFVLLCLTMAANSQIRVACIGNSITYGHGLKREETYPAQLQHILGSGWDVQNFGVSGRTLLSHGDFPYIKEKAYADAKAFSPDVVIIKLGTNDAKPQNWKFSDEFVADYTALITELRSLPSNPIVMVCLPVPAYGINFRINDTIVNNEVTALVKTVAKQNKVQLIDLYKALSGHPEWFPDKIHPDKDGAAEMAKLISGTLLKNKKKISRHKKKVAKTKNSVS